MAIKKNFQELRRKTVSKVSEEERELQKRQRSNDREIHRKLKKMEIQDIKCGVGPFKPRWLQPFARTEVYLAVYCVVGLMMGTFFTYTVSVLSTLEKRFKMTSRHTGIILAGNDISQVILSVLVSYFGNSGKRTMFMGLGVWSAAFSCLLAALPHLIYGPGEEALAVVAALESPEEHLSSNKTESLVSSSNETGTVSLCHKPFSPDCGKDALEESGTVLGAVVILFLSQLLWGVIQTVYYNIGIVYLDDNVNKKESPVYYTVSMVVRVVGPVLGFFLGSRCLSWYVVPQYKPNVSLRDPRWLGAWWMGYLVLACLLGVCGTLLFFFPAILPATLVKKLKTAYKEEAEKDGEEKVLKDPSNDFLLYKRNQGVKENLESSETTLIKKLNTSYKKDIDKNSEEKDTKDSLEDVPLNTENQKLEKNSENIITSTNLPKKKTILVKESYEGNEKSGDTEKPNEVDENEVIVAEDSEDDCDHDRLNEEVHNKPFPLTTDTELEYYLHLVRMKKQVAKPSMKRLPAALKRLFTNKVFLGQNINTTLVLFAYAGYWSFKPKYLEFQFRKSASEATFFTGVASLLASILGFIISGCILKLSKPGPRWVTGYSLFLTLVTGTGMLGLMFIGCPQLQMNGPYSWNENLTSSSCMADCGCGDRYSPVCSQDGATTFYSSCYAGCTVVDTTVSPVVYKNCSCISVSAAISQNVYKAVQEETPKEVQEETLKVVQEETSKGVQEETSKVTQRETSKVIQEETPKVGQEEISKEVQEETSSEIQEEASNVFGIHTNSAELGTATQGYCDDDCDAFLIYLIAATINKLLNATGRIGSILIYLRGVEERDKALALGLINTFLSLFAFIPGPIVMGMIIDSACIIWDSTCGEKGNCWLYDSEKFKFLIHAVPATFIYLSAIGDIMMFVYSKNVVLYGEDEESFTVKLGDVSAKKNEKNPNK